MSQMFGRRESKFPGNLVYLHREIGLSFLAWFRIVKKLFHR